jgi:transketolase
VKLDKNKIKIFSQIGMRATFGMACLELVKEYPNLIVCTADVSTSAGLDRFRKNFKDNYVDVGIAEQNLIGVATGLSDNGFEVFTTTFSPFQTLRCCEQIKVNLGYMKNKVTMIGLASGLILGELGFTHASIEDIGAIRSIPNIKIVSPSDSGELIKCLESSMREESSMYIRLTGGSNNKVFNYDDYDFEIGKSIELRSGKDVCIISNGQILSECMDAADKLMNENISCSVVNMHTIKPIDEIKLIDIMSKFKLIITVEEHNIIGGLGSAVAETISKNGSYVKQIFLGVNDTYAKGGNYIYMKDFFNISAEKIYKRIKNEIK